MLSDADALFVEEDYDGAVAAYTDVSAWLCLLYAR